MKVTTKNIKAKKKQLVTLACKIVHARDTGCQFCGRLSGKMDASHIVPKSRGFWWSVDTGNIIKLCVSCHRKWHDDPIWGERELRTKCPAVYEYTQNQQYTTTRVNVGQAQKKANDLEEAASHYEVI
jgi:hypothetical protein